jgi:preprotein translocase subunit SecA
MRRFASDRVTSIMERLGLDDDTYIESGIVGKTIESAQSRVEGFNFDIRKRVVEFDDVINKQRETIYAERDKVLRNEDLTETVRAFLDEEVESLCDIHLSGALEQWGTDALIEAVKRMGFTAEEVDEDELWSLRNREAVAAHLHELVEEKLAAKEAEFGEEWSTIERFVLLRSIDTLWVEHLTELDDMRRGIGLRGYAQQDPLNEFRKEAFSLFEELSGFIRHGVASTIFRVTVTRQPAPSPSPTGLFPMAGPGQPARGISSGNSTSTTGATGAATGVAAGITRTAAARAGSGGSLGATGPVAPGGRPVVPGAGAQARPGHTPTGEKIGRNDACWCGSGVKYKKCHGR